MERIPLSSLNGCRIFIRYEIRNGREVVSFYRSSSSISPKPIMVVNPENLFDGDGNYFDIDLPLEIKR